MVMLGLLDSMTNQTQGQDSLLQCNNSCSLHLGVESTDSGIGSAIHEAAQYHIIRCWNCRKKIINVWYKYWNGMDYWNDLYKHFNIQSLKYCNLYAFELSDSKLGLTRKESRPLLMALFRWLYFDSSYLLSYKAVQVSAPLLGGASEHPSLPLQPLLS